MDCILELSGTSAKDAHIWVSTADLVAQAELKVRRSR
jgi:hypothetical protein